MFLLADPDIHLIPSDTLKVIAEDLALQLKENPETTLHSLGEKAIDFGLKVVAAFLIYIIGAWCIKKIRNGLRGVMNKRKIEPSLSSFVISLATITLYLVLIILSISALGINTTSLAALLAAGGVAIGAALSGTVQNFAGGLMLMVFKPFKAGDFISVQGFSGTVTEVSIFNTTIITPDNREITIPNGSLSNSNIDNYSAKKIRRVEWNVSVEYSSDAEEFIRTVKEILSSDDRILDASVPEASDPFVALSSLNDSGICFTVRAWVKVEDYWDVYFDNLKAMYSVLPARGFPFAYPHMDVTVTETRKQTTQQ